MDEYDRTEKRVIELCDIDTRKNLGLENDMKSIEDQYQVLKSTFDINVLDNRDICVEQEKRLSVAYNKFVLILKKKVDDYCVMNNGQYAKIPDIEDFEGFGVILPRALYCFGLIAIIPLLIYCGITDDFTLVYITVIIIIASWVIDMGLKFHAEKKRDTCVNTKNRIIFLDVQYKTKISKIEKFVNDTFKDR